MNGAAASVPHDRQFGVDERGVALQATWRLDRGFINLSLWRNNVCVETFHLAPAAAADFIAFLARGLASATSVAPLASVEPIGTPTLARPAVQASLANLGRSMRSKLASGLKAAGSRIDPH
jgi:hypothetical protein